MKNTSKYLILIAIVTFFAYSTAFAQNEPVTDEPVKSSAIGIKFGRMASDLWFIGEDYSDDSPVKTLTSFNLGISFDTKLSEYTLFNAEIMYMKKGRGTDIEHWNIYQFNRSPFEPFSIHSIVFSQSIFLNTKGRLAFYAGPEIYQAIPIRIITRREGALRPRSFDLGLGLKAGIHVPLYQSILIKIEINGTSGIIPVFSKSEIKATDDKRYEGIIALNKTLAGNVALSYRF